MKSDTEQFTYIKILHEQLEIHGFTLKALLITILGMILPFIFPFLGITLLVIIDFWTSYKAGKAKGIKLYSEGLRRSIKKWTEYLLTLIVCIIVDAIVVNAIDDYWRFFFTHIAVVTIAVTELKSISENFAGASLIKVLKIVTRYAISKFGDNNKEISDLLKEEMDSKKSKEETQKQALKNQEKNKNRGLKDDN